MNALLISNVKVSAIIVMATLLIGASFSGQLARAEQPEAQSMFYKARSPETGNMWDVWVYLHEGTYYLYHLAQTGKKWDNISMASSPDGVHWKEIGPVLLKDPKAVWMGTGSTWKSPNFAKDGKFFINFSQQFPDQPQTIFFGESTDLIHWKRLDRAKYEFVQDTRWYEPKGRWDCIWTIPRPGGGLYGYWTATPKAETGGSFGFGQTLDGVTWETLPPPKTPGITEGEIGAVAKIGEKYYMMRGFDWNMFTLVADRPQGPFLPAKKNFHLLAHPTYFSRFLPTPDGLLVCHHTSSTKRRKTGIREVYFSPLKSTVLDDQGTLRLGWWKGNEKMKHELVKVQLPSGEPRKKASIAMLGNTFDTERGIILEGTLKLPEDADSPRRGLYVECGAGHGAAILLDSHGKAELGSMKSDGSGFKAEKRMDREMSFGQPATFRLLLKYQLMEFYLDDILIKCYRLPGDTTGRIGLIYGTDSRAIGKLKAWY